MDEGRVKNTIPDPDRLLAENPGITKIRSNLHSVVPLDTPQDTVHRYRPNNMFVVELRWDFAARNTSIQYC